MREAMRRSGGWIRVTPSGCATSPGVGLVLGARVRVIEREPFSGPITLEVSGRSQVLAHDMAKLVYCAI